MAPIARRVYKDFMIMAPKPPGVSLTSSRLWRIRITVNRRAAPVRRPQQVDARISLPGAPDPVVGKQLTSQEDSS